MLMVKIQLYVNIFHEIITKEYVQSKYPQSRRVAHKNRFFQVCSKTGVDNSHDVANWFICLLFWLHHCNNRSKREKINIEYFIIHIGYILKKIGKEHTFPIKSDVIKTRGICYY